MPAIRDKQIHAIKEMLNFNQAISETISFDPIWKILIYDQTGQDIISPLFNVKELLDLGVTLHLHLNSNRGYLPGVPAIYFCEPSDENLQQIKKDFENNLYDTYYFNFITSISRNSLETLAQFAINTNNSSKIHKVYDQFLNFVSLENDLFVLKHHNPDQISYYALNRATEHDFEIEALLDTITDNLFSVFVTIGSIPIIRSSRNNAAEMISKRLEKKIRDNYFDARNNLFQIDTSSGNFNFHRPCLIVLDRNLDLATPLHHPWIYQALIHDLLQLSLNRIMMKTEKMSEKTKTYEFDNSKDKFWEKFKGSPFPAVAEAIQVELDQYRASEEEVKKLKTMMNSNEMNITDEPIGDNTAKISSAVSSIPELLEKKRLIDMHTNIATELLESIKNRKLDTFFEIEEKIMSKMNVDKAFGDLINDSDVANLDDKLRLFLIYYICSPDPSNIDFESFETILRNQGCDFSAFDYIKRWKKYGKITEINLNYDGNAIKTVGMFSKLVSQGSAFLMEGVKNLVVKQHNLPITRIVDQLTENKNSKENEEYLYLDPKQLKNAESNKSRISFQDIYVFIVGGGNYIEYHNLLAYSKQKTQSGKAKNIVYGSTTLEDAQHFLKQLQQLGKENC